MSTYFLVDPFILPYWFYNIRRELINVFSIIVYFPSILKILIHRNILPTDPNKKIKLIIYYNKFKTSNFVIKNLFLSFDWSFAKNNVTYQFKYLWGDCISENNNIYVGLTSTTLSRWLTMHLSDTSSIARHLKKHSCPTTELRKILTKNTILEHQNNKQKLHSWSTIY